MEKYLVQYINEEILESLGNNQPIDIMTQLLFDVNTISIETTLDEGKIDLYFGHDNTKYDSITRLDISSLRVKFIEGNPALEVSFGRYVPFKDYYNNQKDFDTMLKYYNKNRLMKDIKCVYNGKLKDKDYDESKRLSVFTEINNSFRDKIKNIKELDTSKVDNIDYWLSQLENKTSIKLLIYLCSGTIECNILKINENTNKSLLKYSILVVETYIKYYENIINNDNKLYKRINASCYNKKEETLNKIKESLPILKRELNRLEGLLQTNLF